jgi:hypothetical protein
MLFDVADRGHQRLGVFFREAEHAVAVRTQNCPHFDVTCFAFCFVAVVDGPNSCWVGGLADRALLALKLKERLPSA